MFTFKARRWQRQDCFLIALTLCPLPTLADEPRPVSVHETLPFGQSPIDYWNRKHEDNPLADLQRRIETHDVELPYVETFGYLPAILKELNIPVESQLLRFRSGSPHRTHITAERPRAIYFNDDVAVAWHPGTVLLEFATQDPQKGTLFYTMVNRDDAVLEFHRGSSQACLGCHHKTTGGGSPATGVAVPGHLLQAQLGEDAEKYFFGHVLTHAAPVELRWEAWYVTGLRYDQRHRGNLSRPEDTRRFADDPTFHRPIIDLADEFDTDRYLAATSDMVAHLIYDHQMLGQNLLSRLSYEHQLHVRSDIETLLVRYLLLADETSLDKPVLGKSAYADWYRHRGPKDDQGRSLLELDLETRLFRHRISPLVGSRMVQRLPAEAKQSLFARLNSVLTGTEMLEAYVISEADRQATLEVLRATVPDWP